MENGSAVFSVEQVLDEAVKQAVSDVHIYPRDTHLCIDFRSSGRLFHYNRVYQADHSFIRRIKALARMDLAETRVPQDGAFELATTDGMARFRAATLPTVYGETVALRVLPTEIRSASLLGLGMCEPDVATVSHVLHGPPGLVIVCGATGTGKTTTLYVLMQELARSGRRVVSIEDPVEVQLPDCHQVEVREATGLTYDVGLRSLLRHDPDVIMVGEIRDEATARTVVRAALTGHCVLTSTHSRDVVGVLARLTEFGVPRMEIAEVLRCVIVQTAHSVPDREFQQTVDSPFRFEAWPVSLEMARAIADPIHWSELRRKWSLGGGGSG